MARFLVLIHGDEAKWDAISDDEMRQIDDAHRALRETAPAGTIVASGQVDASRLARRIGHPGDTTLQTEGPFADSATMPGGFYVLRADTLGDATALISGLAEIHHDHSWVEVWTLVDHGE